MVISIQLFSLLSHCSNTISLVKVITKLPQVLIDTSKKCTALKNTCDFIFNVQVFLEYGSSFTSHASLQVIESSFSEFFSSLQVVLVCFPNASRNVCFADPCPVHLICCSAEHEVPHL